MWRLFEVKQGEISEALDMGLEEDDEVVVVDRRTMVHRLCGTHHDLVLLDLE